MHDADDSMVFQLRSGKTLSLSEIQALRFYAGEQEVQMAYVESLTDYGVHVDEIPRENLAEAMEDFSFRLSSAQDTGAGGPDTIFAANDIDQWHHRQADQLIRDACAEYFQQHRQELLPRVQLPSGAEISLDELEEAAALTEAWTRQRMAEEVLKKTQEAPSREDVLRMVQTVSGNLVSPGVRKLLLGAFQKRFPHLFTSDYDGCFF